MDAWLAAIEQWPLATHLRSARWTYAALNAAHIFALAMLVGASLPLALHLVGLWRNVDREQLARVLVPIAATGLFLTILTGLLLFAIRAREYADLTVFQIKIALVVGGALSAILAHTHHGWWFERSAQSRLLRVGVISLIAWPCALICGRLIAFAG